MTKPTSEAAERGRAAFAAEFAKLTPEQQRRYTAHRMAMRRQNAAFAAALNIGDYSGACDILRQDWTQTVAPSHDPPTETGHNQRQVKRKRRKKNKLIRILCRLLK